MRLARERLQREHAALAGGAAGPGALGGGAFIRDRVPLAAGFALAGPAAVNRAAVLADEGLGLFGHAGTRLPRLAMRRSGREHSKSMRTIQEHIELSSEPES